ncbi:MAG: hypothetical protein KBS46_02520 [Clostridiales bacterium]|nr:hypothetical protein [Candidatus Apopatocola equi]
MRELLSSGRSLPEAYHQALLLLEQYGEITPCPDYNTTQRECSMTLYVEQPLAEPRISRLFIGGFMELEQYRQEMLDGILDFEIGRGNWEYTYHARIAVQYPFILRELRRNSDSRRAVIDVRDWRHDSAEGNTNPACLQHLQFFIRSGALHAKILFRSNDACEATFMNSYALICLQERLAGELGVEMGSFTLRANSFHCYEKNFGLLEGYCRRIRQAEESDELCYFYEGDWKELMLSARSEIEAKVAELKSRD